MSAAVAEKAKAIIAQRRLETAQATVVEQTDPEMPAKPWLCSGEWCAGCSFEQLDGEHPKDCTHHDPVGAAGWAFWRDELPARAVAQIKMAKRQGVTLPKALLERVS
jgi:hypothetical protein